MISAIKFNESNWQLTMLAIVIVLATLYGITWLVGLLGKILRSHTEHRVQKYEQRKRDPNQLSIEESLIVMANRYDESPSYVEETAYLRFSMMMAGRRVVILILALVLAAACILGRDSLYPSLPVPLSIILGYITLVLLFALEVIGVVTLVFGLNRALYKRSVASNDGEVLYTWTVVTPSGIHRYSAADSDYLLYTFEELSRAVETKNYHHIVTADKTILTFSKEGFTRGNYSGFLAMIEGLGLSK